jgi:replication-associated recombination protein RarA
MREIFLGPPGTGKTSKLLELVDKELDSGTPSRYIGYFAFTRMANEELSRIWSLAGYKNIGRNG